MIPLLVPVVYESPPGCVRIKQYRSKQNCAVTWTLREPRSSSMLQWPGSSSSVIILSTRDTSCAQKSTLCECVFCTLLDNESITPLLFAYFRVILTTRGMDGGVRFLCMESFRALSLARSSTSNGKHQKIEILLAQKSAAVHGMFGPVPICCLRATSPFLGPIQ